MSLHPPNRARSLPLPQRGRVRTIGWTLLLSVTLFLSVLTLPCAAQTKWFKYDGNPVLDVGPPGSCDDGRAWVSKVLVQGNVYKMWYEAFDGTRERICYATSTDKVTWRKHPYPVLNPGPPGAFDSFGVFQPDVLFHRSKYHMWYVTNTYYPNVTIGYASSPDGISWKKHRLPVLTRGPSSSWESMGVCKPSVIPSESGFRMWYSAWSTGNLVDMKIGHATAADETTWVRLLQTPVLFPGSEGGWDAQMLGHSRVIFNGEQYQMWFSAGPYNAGGPIGRAISVDGINWQKNPPDPVLRGGGPGSWDQGPLSIGGIHFDGASYHMWYAADNGRSVWRSGYAVSPAGLEVGVRSLRTSRAKDDSIWISVRLPASRKNSFSAAFRTPTGASMDVIQLLDDGIHHDSLAGDGLFANTWHPEEDQIYFVDLRMHMWENGQRKSFTMKDAANFATIRNVSLDGLEFLGDRTPHPGDTLFVKLLLHHQGKATTIHGVTASMTAADSWTSQLAEYSPNYGDLTPGSTVRTSGYYRLVLKPDCPPGVDVRFNVTVSSLGVPFLHQTLNFQVYVPWWKNPWMEWIYAVLAAAVIIGAIRFLEVTKLRTRIAVLERERALELERARISQDMRDEVGSSLSEIAILSELVRKKPDEAAVRMNEISERTAELIDSVSEIVWAMNPKNDTLDNLIGHIRRYSVRYLDLAGVACEFPMPEEIPSWPLASKIRQNIFLVVKEVLHEAVNRAGASLVRIEVLINELNIQIRIQHNGPSTESLAMKKRIGYINGRILIDSGVEHGTRITLIVPFPTRLHQRFDMPGN